ncbi:MAG: bifunctional [glutamate--ammonia ligase]-adenylyl-L-tyrosine phosphorylase/[glutamate--ammonia-ligase] adenylyltransferase, partial [Gammaproteobacteria bacterium]
MNARRALQTRGRERLTDIGLAEAELGAPGALAAALGWSDFLYRTLLSAGASAATALLARAAVPQSRADWRETAAVQEGLALIALREMAGLQSVRASLLAASKLAEATLTRALAASAETDAPELVVFGLGKLGGRELNFYSDLDLVFAHTGSGERDDRRYLRRARAVLARLEGGFRIDLRLRPFGQSGPLVMSLGAMETYFQHHGRDWERYAWLKARSVAGARAAGRDFLRQLHPFIYRRYLDYHAVEALREMKRQIEVEAGDSAADIKRGPGGIREIEFIVQAFQLVRGGREAALAGSGLRAALGAVQRLGHLAQADAAALNAAYYFLRRVENRLQMATLAPVHTLPEDPMQQALLAASLEFDETAAFSQTLKMHRERVRTIFSDILGAPPRTRPARNAAQLLWRGEQLEQASAELGLGEGVEALKNFQQSRVVRLMSERGRRALDRLGPELIAAAVAERDPDAVLQRLLGLLTALVRRSAYLALLVERPAARARLVHLVGRSPWLAERLAATPAALDELLDERVCAPAAPAQVARQLRAIVDVGTSSEEAAERLREFNELQRLKISAAWIDGSFAPERAERTLTVLGERSVRAAVELAAARMRARHGSLEHELLAIAYGKLGSRELGFASDLDLVFVYDTAHTTAEDGLAAESYLARLAQRSISVLGMPTLLGPLYAVDTRLRPEGAAGLLLSRFDAWQRYQHEQAWLWERQALLRARPVAGSARLARLFHVERRRLLTRAIEPATLARELRAMRARVAEVGPARNATGAALVDGEFLAALWLLKAAPQDPAVIRASGLAAQMTALARAGHVPAAPDLAWAVASLREATNRRVLGLAPDTSAETRAREFIAERWAHAFETASTTT